MEKHKEALLAPPESSMGMRGTSRKCPAASTPPRRRTEITEGGNYERKVDVARNVSYLKAEGPSYMEPTDKRINPSCRCYCFLKANLRSTSLTMVLLSE